MRHCHTHFSQSLLKLLLVFRYSGDPTDLWPLCSFTSQRTGELLLDVLSPVSSKGDLKKKKNMTQAAEGGSHSSDVRY